VAGTTKKQIVVGVDIGNTKVCTIIGEKMSDGTLEIIGAGLAPVSGLRRGTIVDIDEVITAISSSLEEAERMSGIPIEKAYVSISGSNVFSTSSRGVIAIGRADGEITKEDVARALEAARAISLPPNRDIIHVIPRSFIVDGQEEIRDPVGMTGVRLEVDAHVVSASTPTVKNLLKCAYQAGLDVEELVLSSLASARALFSGKQKEIGVMLLDIGGGTTDIAVFEEGEVLHTAVLPVGACHVTNDIAIGLRTSIDIAEKVKIDYGTALPALVPEREVIDISEIDPTLEPTKISRRYVAEIIEARMIEILVMARDELKKIGRDGLLPAGVVLSGGGSKIPGIIDLAKDNLRLPVQVGIPYEAKGIIDKEKIDDPVYSTAIGLALWGMDSERGKERFMTNLMEGLKGFRGIFSKIKSSFFK